MVVHQAIRMMAVMMGLMNMSMVFNGQEQDVGIMMMEPVISLQDDEIYMVNLGTRPRGDEMRWNLHDSIAG